MFWIKTMGWGGGVRLDVGYYPVASAPSFPAGLEWRRSFNVHNISGSRKFVCYTRANCNLSLVLSRFCLLFFYQHLQYVASVVFMDDEFMWTIRIRGARLSRTVLRISIIKSCLERIYCICSRKLSDSGISCVLINIYYSNTRIFVYWFEIRLNHEHFEQPISIICVLLVTSD